MLWSDARDHTTRTHDRTQTFETLTKRLPQEHAYDLVFRHALDVDESGGAVRVELTDTPLDEGDARNIATVRW